MIYFDHFFSEDSLIENYFLSYRKLIFSDVFSNNINYFVGIYLIVQLSHVPQKAGNDFVCISSGAVGVDGPAINLRSSK